MLEQEVAMHSHHQALECACAHFKDRDACLLTPAATFKSAHKHNDGSTWPEVCVRTQQGRRYVRIVVFRSDETLKTALGRLQNTRAFMTTVPPFTAARRHKLNALELHIEMAPYQSAAVSASSFHQYAALVLRTVRDCEKNATCFHSASYCNMGVFPTGVYWRRFEGDFKEAVGVCREMYLTALCSLEKFAVELGTVQGGRAAALFTWVATELSDYQAFEYVANIFVSEVPV